MQLGTIVTCVKIKKLTLILLSCVRGTVLIYSPIICTWYSTHVCTVVYVCHSFFYPTHFVPPPDDTYHSLLYSLLATNE